MNILYLTNHLNIGGITSYVLTLASGLKKRGHSIFVASSEGQLVDRFIQEGITFVPIPIRTKAEISFKVFRSYFKLRKFIGRNNIDIIHANTRVTQVLACLLQKSTRRPFISTCHGFFKKRLSRRIFACWGQKVIAISVQVKEHLVNDFGIKEDSIRIIHNGIDIGRFTEHRTPDTEQLRNKLGLGSGPVIGIIARLSDVKGHIYLIQAMKRVLEERPHAQLLIIGEGKTQKELDSLVKELKIEKNVIFIPQAADTVEALSVMDLFVMPSLKEGLGLALMEAMASGLPVIASGVGGIKTLIRHGQNGLLVEPADAKGLSEAILELLNNPDKAKILGKEAQEFIRENFSQDNMVQETELLYKECLGA